MKTYLKNIVFFILLFILFILSDTFSMIPCIIFDLDIKNLTIVQQSILYLYNDVLLTIIIIIIYRKHLIKKFKDFIKNFKTYFPITFRYWLIGLGLMYIINILITMFSPIKEPTNENLVQSLIQNTPFITLVMTSITAPFIEEIVFRKAISDAIPSKYIFIIVSGFIFGFLHIMNATSFYEYFYILSYGALGSVFAYILIKTDNIFAPIMAHMIHNTILTLLAIITMVI